MTTLTPTLGWTAGKWEYSAGRIWAAGKSILKITHLLPFGDPENQANAHLISAAPSMYEALSLALLVIQSGPGKRDEEEIAALKEGMAALALARGEVRS